MWRTLRALGHSALPADSYLKKVWRDVVFVDGTDEEYIQQICEYSEEAEHDDAPDSLSSIVRLLWQRKNENESGLR